MEIDNVLGVDPGKTTGLFMVSGTCKLHCQPLEWEAVRTFENILVTWPIEHVVIEQFNVMEKRTRLAGADIQWPLDIIGAVKWACLRLGDGRRMNDLAVPTISVWGQWNYERSKVKDDDLDALGWLAKPVTVNRHSNDAARHVYAWGIRRSKNASNG